MSGEEALPAEIPRAHRGDVNEADLPERVFTGTTNVQIMELAANLGIDEARLRAFRKLFEKNAQSGGQSSKRRHKI